MPAQNLSHFAPVFQVNDINKTLEWYKDKLGFSVQFTWEDPITYAIARRDSITIHFTLHENLQIPPKAPTSLYIFVYDVELLFHEFEEKGITEGDLSDADYGMRDFDITDLNGYRLTFGQNAEEIHQR